MRNRHFAAAAALCVSILACTPALGRAAERSDGVSTGEPARSTEAESSSLVRDGAGGGSTPQPVIRFASDAEWLGKRNPGVRHEPSTRSVSSNLLARSIATEVARLNGSTRTARHSTGVLQQATAQNRNWIQRHPVLFGTLVGFGAGFLVGYLPGNDAVFYDFTAEFNGLVLGGIGAGAGALVGWAVSR